MDWFINDMSLQGQFQTPSEFKIVLEELIKAIRSNEYLRPRLHTTRDLSQRLVCPNLTFVQAIRQLNDSLFSSLVLSWITRNGPFIDDSRLLEIDDYFEYMGNDVTNQGLGESARRIKSNIDSSSFSFLGGAINFKTTPLNVQHGLPQQILGMYDVPNLWDVPTLTNDALNQGIPITSWQTMIQYAQVKFTNLLVPNSVLQFLAKEAYSEVIKNSVLDQMEILNTYLNNRDADGAENAIAQTIINNFFVGSKAKFTGESATNKINFKDDLTFPDPENATNQIFAHYHGKINHQVFRMHFEWPVPIGSKLKIVYIGQKITKQ